MAQDEFQQLFEPFKRMLEPYGQRMHVSADTPQWFGVDMAPESERDPSTWFGAARVGKRYVSYYLMPVYVQPSLLDGVSPGLKKRMQGKSCFNFAKVDEPLLGELEALTRRGYEATAGRRRMGRGAATRSGVRVRS